MTAKEIESKWVWQFDANNVTLTERRLVDVVTEYAESDLKQTRQGVRRAMYTEGNSLLRWEGVNPQTCEVENFGSWREAYDVWLERYYAEFCNKGLHTQLYDTRKEAATYLAVTSDTLELLCDLVNSMRPYDHEIVMGICCANNWEVECDTEDFFVCVDHENEKCIYFEEDGKAAVREYPLRG